MLMRISGAKQRRAVSRLMTLRPHPSASTERLPGRNLQKNKWIFVAFVLNGYANNISPCHSEQVRPTKEGGRSEEPRSDSDHHTASGSFNENAWSELPEAVSLVKRPRDPPLRATENI